MYIRIGILGRARQAMGIARLHAPREALYIDVKYNSLTHSANGEIVETGLTGRALLAPLSVLRCQKVLLWLRAAASTNHLALGGSYSRGCAGSCFLFPRSCLPPSHRARRDAITTTFVDLLYLLASYPHVHFSNMSSQGIHCPSADGEARQRRTLGA
jgi:hypothetical protein